MAIVYWQNGAIFGSGTDHVLQPGEVAITQAAYDALLAAADAASDANANAQANAGCLAAKAVYNDLKASAHTVDWAEATFQALSGYKPGSC